jgi:nicotinamidase-related amidase
MTQGPGTARAMPNIMIEPKDCALVLVDQQAGLAFGVGSIDRQMRRTRIPATAITDFLAANILNKCGRAVPALCSLPQRTRKTRGVHTKRKAARVLKVRCRKKRID